MLYLSSSCAASRLKYSWRWRHLGRPFVPVQNQLLASRQVGRRSGRLCSSLARIKARHRRKRFPFEEARVKACRNTATDPRCVSELVCRESSGAIQTNAAAAPMASSRRPGGLNARSQRVGNGERKIQSERYYKAIQCASKNTSITLMAFSSRARCHKWQIGRPWKGEEEGESISQILNCSAK